MTDEDIEDLYDLIKKYHTNYLSKNEVILPKLKNKKGKYTKDALVLILLAKDYPNTKIISKQDLTNFIRGFYPDTNDVQQARHLGMQKGWYIITGTRGENIKIPKGTYHLMSLEIPHPSYVQNRKTGIMNDDFEKIKKEYNWRCAVCGSQENKPHLIRKNTIVQLQQGHMNPKKDLIAGNIIPQCQICNRPDRNRWIYDKTGRVIALADTPDGMRVVLNFLKSTSKSIKQDIYNFLKQYLKIE
ncbi:hypothetical protein BKH44_03805 [Helicobacter sp. 13S00477-4]|nr:hypothetical protein BKH44_03805 [Helicobacter sp. 13S00477-4]